MPIPANFLGRERFWGEWGMYRRSMQGWMKHLDFIILDIWCLHVAFILAYIFRMGLHDPYGDLAYRNLALVLTLIDLSVLICFETLKNVLRRGYLVELTRTFQHVFLVVMILACYMFTIQAGNVYSRIVIFLFAGLYFAISYLLRSLYKYLLKGVLTAHNAGGRSLFIVTTESSAEEIIKNISGKNYGSYRIAGLAVVNRDCVGSLIHGIPVVANAANLSDYVCRHWVDEVFICLDSNDPTLEKIATQISEMGITVHIAMSQPVCLAGKKLMIEKVGNYNTITSTMKSASARQLFLKRAMDIAGGLAGCAITLVLTVIIGPLIYIQSPGPIFFAQERVGRNGKKFKMYKFRSMYLDAEERKKELEKENRVKSGMMFKLDFDPRIIGSRKNPDGTIKRGIGNYIRDWSLDEFPQFFNVLKGDMSLVGTRPPTLDEWEKYELHHRARLAIKPGITGMWQVSGRSGITDFEQVVKLDTEYIREWSLMLDVKLLLRTVAVVVLRRGAM